MDAKDFLITAKRICDTTRDCRDCPLCEHGTCLKIDKNEIDKVVAEVEKWKEANPATTRQSEFLKVYPDAKIFFGSIYICPCAMDKYYECRGTEYKSCEDCRKAYWLSEI